MAGGRKTTHRDDDYLMTGTHSAGTSTTLRNVGADFKANGGLVRLFVENTTQDTSGYIKTITEDEITVDGITGSLTGNFVTVKTGWTTENGVAWEGSLIEWDNADTYKIYKTSLKSCLISSEQTDLSRGWKSDPKTLIDGWRPDDIDIDRKNPGKVFGPGQPEEI